MSGIRVEGSVSGNVMEVDANHNAFVNLPMTQAQAGFATMNNEVDSGSITASRLLRMGNISADLRASIGVDTLQALYNFTSTSQVTGDWKHQFTTMTMTQSAGFLNINPALATVSGNFANLQSWHYFTLQGDGQLVAEIVGEITGTAPPANQIFEAGFFVAPATGIAPADGVFFRLTSSGLVGVMSYSGAETLTGVIYAALQANTNGSYVIKCTQRQVEFWVTGATGNMVLGGTINVPAGQSTPFLTMNLPLCVHMRNSGTVSGGVTVKIGTCHVTQGDLSTSKPWAHQMAIQGNAYQGQEGDTQGSLAIYSNAALAAAAGLANATAAAQFTGLGGVALVLPILASGTDGILFAYQNPLGSTTLPPKTLVVNGVSVDASVVVVLTGGPLNLVMGVAFGSTAVSLATADTGSFVTNTTKSPRRVALGTLTLPVTAPAGTATVEVTRTFASPIVVNPGEWFVITCRNVGTVTSLGSLVMTATVDHFFE